jgi:hypothetical protein
MPINPDINRFLDLVSIIPEGTFYENDGIVVPYRNNPYDIQFTTETPNRQFGVFLNGNFLGVVSSDAMGNVVVSALLALGENDVEIVDGVTQERTSSLLTTRKWATWLAAFATELETIDNNIDTVQLDSSLPACLPADLEAAWGPIKTDQSNDIGYDVEAYRNVLMEIFQARRLFGAKFRGHEVALATFCGVPPLDWYRLFTGKNWILGGQFLVNNFFDTLSHELVPEPNISGVTITALSQFANPGAANLIWDPIGPSISYTDPVLGITGVGIDMSRSGVYEIPGQPEPAAWVGIPGPYTFVGSAVFTLNIDQNGVINIPIAPGTYSAAALAIAFNAALVADVRYGVGYSAAFGTFAGGPRLRLTSVGTGSFGSIILYNCTAIPVLFQVITQPIEYDGYQDTLVTLNVVTPSLPLGLTIATFTCYEAPLPDNWFVFGGTASLQFRVPQQFDSSFTSLQVVSTGTDVTIFREAISEADPYKGFEFVFGTWLWSLNTGLNVFLGWSFDGGVTWNESSAIPLTASTDPYQLGVFMSTQFIYDPNATSLNVRIRVSSGGPAFTINVDETQLVQPEITAAFLGRNTVPRSRHRSFFGHLIWAWCLNPLNPAEVQSTGLGTPPNLPVGQLDLISSCHTQIDRFNVTEFDLVSGLPINLAGVLQESDWAVTTLTNLQIV